MPAPVELMYRRGGAVTLPDGREASSEFTAVRLLLADGYAPTTQVQTRWPGSRHVSLSGTLGGWAKLVAEESPKMQFAQHRRRQGTDEPAGRVFGEWALQTPADQPPKASGDATGHPSVGQRRGGLPAVSPTAAELLPVLIELFRARGVDRMPTEAIVAALGARLGRAITANRLTRTLKPHGVAPRQFRLSGRQVWGYRLSELAESRDAGSERAPDRVGHLDAEQEWATRVAMAAVAMAHRVGW